MTARTYTPRKREEKRVQIGPRIPVALKDRFYRWAEGQGISYEYALEVLVEAGLEFYNGEPEVSDG